MVHALLEPRSLLLVAANLLPVFGVVLMGWDTFVLIALYWLETAVIGFWTLVGIMRAPGSPPNLFGTPGGSPVPRLAMALFILAHAGIFMFVHFMFVLAIFGSGWESRIGGPLDLVTTLVLPLGLWVPLGALFVMRGMAIVGVPRETLDTHTVVIGLYVRIIVLHMTIIFGAMLSLLIHSVIGLVLLVGLKTLADLFMGPIIAWVDAAAREAEKKHGVSR